ncbi:MAG TPA: hypothetical protein VGE07_21045 [Herpetosiphonaceae bacterium]
MNRPTDAELLELRADLLFVTDASGRLRFHAEPGYPEDELDPAPRLWLGRTRAATSWRFRRDLSADLIAVLEPLCQAVPPLADPADPAPWAAPIREALGAVAPVAAEERGPAYWIPPAPVPPIASIVTEATAHVLERFFPWKRSSRLGFAAAPLCATIIDDVAVAICHCARLTDAAAEAGVETAASERGKGYSRAAVAGWAAALRQGGRQPLYSTSWDNLASQGVARSLEMDWYGEDWSVT